MNILGEKQLFRIDAGDLDLMMVARSKQDALKIWTEFWESEGVEPDQDRITNIFAVSLSGLGGIVGWHNPNQAGVAKEVIHA